MNADRKIQVIAKYARINRDNHQLRLENEQLRERHMELEDQLLASRNRKWKDLSVALLAEVESLRCELRDAKAACATADRLLRGARDRRDLWEHRYWTVREELKDSLPGVRLARRTARTPESGNGDRTPPAGSDTLSLSTNGTETPDRIRASRVPGDPLASPSRSVGREREVTSNGDRRKTPSRASAAVARRDLT